MLAETSHKDHVEVSEWAAEVTDGHGPFDPGFLDMPARNRALAGG